MNQKTTVFGAAIFSLFFGWAAHAGDCAGQFCVGTWVIDQSDSIGTVVAVGPAIVTYTVPGYNPVSVSPDQLSPETQAVGAIQAGETVIDSSDEIGKVDRVFANGKTQYTIPGYNPEVGEAVSLSQTVQSAPGHAELFAGVTVVDASQEIGTINQVFANGKIQYTIPGYNPSITQSAQLSALVASDGPLTDGTVVIDASDEIGAVQKIFENGDVQYVIPGYSPSIANAASLSPLVMSIGALAHGVSVIDASQEIGTINQLFANGRVQYVIPGYNPSIANANTLSPQVAAASGYPDVVVGTLVVDASNEVGTVHEVFANGEVQYTIPGYNPSIANASALSPEVSQNPNYAKGAYYANESYQIGKATRFFKNGKVQLVSDSGVSSVGTTLAGQVPALNGYSAGTAVTTPNEVAGTVTLVFANGALAYTLQPPATTSDPSPKPVPSTARMFGLASSPAGTDNSDWLDTLSLSLNCGQPTAPLGYYCVGAGDLVDQTADYPALKKKLLAALQQEPGFVSDPTLRAKVITELSK